MFLQIFQWQEKGIKMTHTGVFWDEIRAIGYPDEMLSQANHLIKRNGRKKPKAMLVLKDISKPPSRSGFSLF